MRTRLEQGPFWLGDWRSTGIRSRATAYNTIQFLLAEGLVTKRREGHKILYELIPFTMVGWWPHLTTEREQKKHKRVDKTTKQLTSELLAHIKPRIEVLGKLRATSEDTQKNAIIDLSKQEVLAKIEASHPELGPVEAVVLTHRIMTLFLCPECLMKHGRLELTRIAGYEVTCMSCGLVVHSEELTRDQNKNPPPSSPPR